MDPKSVTNLVKSLQQAETATGQIHSISGSVAMVALTGSHKLSECYYNSQLNLKAGDSCVLIRDRAGARWIIASGYPTIQGHSDQSLPSAAVTAASQTQVVVGTVSNLSAATLGNSPGTSVGDIDITTHGGVVVVFATVEPINNGGSTGHAINVRIRRDSVETISIQAVPSPRESMTIAYPFVISSGVHEFLLILGSTGSTWNLTGANSIYWAIEFPLLYSP